MKRQKRVAAIHDISCFGRCSLTVALPIISSAGIECAVVPTAVLSTHTGGIDGYTFHDLTDEIMPIAKHWKSLDLEFDAIYTGYLGSFHQLDIVSSLFDLLGSNDTLKVVDPVMADNGVLYKSFPADFPKGMRKLCAKADIIVPNITEAVLMLDEPYQEGPYTADYIETLLRKLGEIGAKQVVLTGVHFDDKQLGAAAYDCETGEVEYSFAGWIEGYYHGTGDVFGSALVAALLRGFDLPEATEEAVRFTVGSIARTKAAGTDIRFGVNFESGLEELATRLNIKTR
ncbi:MAG: pyridoxamine kinase [Caldicoprobacterales bacterium]|jgi:pyridoxine kinase|nr:pyridoxamine kinase [Clostridiales bacterium]